MKKVIYKFSFLFAIVALFASMAIKDLFPIVKVFAAAGDFQMLVLGDGISYGAGLTDISKSYANLVFDKYTQVIVGAGSEFFNSSLTSSTTKNLYDQVKTPFIQTGLRSKDIVLVSIGFENITQILFNNNAEDLRNFINGADTDEVLNTKLKAMTDIFYAEISSIISILNQYSKSSTTIVFSTILNPYKNLTNIGANANLGSLIETHVVKMNEDLKSIKHAKLQIIDIKAEFDKLTTSDFNGKFNVSVADLSDLNTEFNHLPNESGHELIAGTFVDEMQIFTNANTVNLKIVSGNITQIMGKILPIEIELELPKTYATTVSVKWTLNGEELTSFKNSKKFSLRLPNIAGMYILTAEVNSISRSQSFNVNYDAVNSFTLRLSEGLLVQTLDNVSPVTFNVVIPANSDAPNLLVNWYINEVHITGNNTKTITMTPSEAITYTIRAQIGNKTQNKTIVVSYAQIKNLNLSVVSGQLDQIVNNLEDVTFSVSIPDFSDPNAKISWFLNDQEVTTIDPTGKEYIFSPKKVGKYEIKVKAESRIEFLVVNVEYLAVSDFTINYDKTLTTQELEGVMDVNFTYTLPQFTDPNLLAQWSVNGEIFEAGKSFSFKPNKVGKYVIAAKIGNVEKREVLNIKYTPILINGKTLNVVGSKEQFKNDIRPIIVRVDLSEANDASTIIWYVGNSIAQVGGQEFWYVINSNEQATRLSITARIGADVSAILIISIFDSKPPEINKLGIILLISAFITFFLLFYAFISKVIYIRSSKY